MKTKVKTNKQERGITLIALVITIIILLMLATITIKVAINGGLINVTDRTLSVYIDKDKEERLEHALEAAKIQKERNKNFNKNTDLDNIIKNDIPEAEISGDTITINGAVFYIDRNKLSVTYKKPEGEIGEGDIPIYSATQIQKIGTGETIYIDGKNYVFDKNKKYVLQNDIEYVGSYANIGELIKNNEVTIEGQGHKIIVTNPSGQKEYYTEENKYYMGANKYGYVVNGLQLYYDGIDNIGTGVHSDTTTIWRDLSGNNKDGALVGGTWGDKYLTLNGTSDGVSIGNQMQDLFKGDNTVEMIVYFDSDDGNAVLFGNYNVNPYVVYMRNSDNSFYFDYNRKYWYTTPTKDLTTGVYHNLSLTYHRNDGIVKEYKNANNLYSISNAAIKTYNENWTSAYIGRDLRTGATCLKGKIAAVRIYDRVLSEAEIETNYKTDQTRFGI